jgi:KDO2-lipid IV(A) lauroyltransferase
LGAGLGCLAGQVIGLRRNEVLRALRRAFPDREPAEHRRITRSVYRPLGRNVAECVLLASGRQDELLDRIDAHGLEHLEAASRGGRGVLVLTAHLGNWELGAVWLAKLAPGFAILAKEFRSPGLSELIGRMRTRSGIRVLPRRGSFRACLRELQQGRLLGFMLDQNMTRDEGVFVEFFGLPACTTPGLAHLSARSKAPVLPGFACRQPGGRHVIRLEPALPPPPAKDPDAILQATQRYSRTVEEAVRRCPEQWIWIHRRWRTRPPTVAPAPG